VTPSPASRVATRESPSRDSARCRRRRPLPLLPLSAHAVARAAPPRRRLSPPRARARGARRRLRTDAPPRRSSARMLSSPTGAAAAA
jgi:hypothetical protein